HKMKYRTVIEDFHDEDFVFQRSNGYPFLTKNLSDRMKRLLKFSEVKKELTPHSFRHTHIPMMTEAGAELSTIMERVGHIDPNTTLKDYTHVTEKMKVTSINNVTYHHTDNLEKLSFKSCSKHFRDIFIKKRGLLISKPRHIKYYLLRLTSCPACRRPCHPCHPYQVHRL